MASLYDVSAEAHAGLMAPAEGTVEMFGDTYCQIDDGAG